MPESKQKPTFPSSKAIKPGEQVLPPTSQPPLEAPEPSRIARLNAKQRLEMTLKLIEFLKKI